MFPFSDPRYTVSHDAIIPFEASFPDAVHHRYFNAFLEQVMQLLSPKGVVNSHSVKYPRVSVAGKKATTFIQRDNTKAVYYAEG